MLCFYFTFVEPLIWTGPWALRRYSYVAHSRAAYQDLGLIRAKAPWYLHPQRITNLNERPDGYEEQPRQVRLLYKCRTG